MPGKLILQYIAKVKKLVSAGFWVYIKLKIDIANDGTEILKCLSFHE